MPPKRNESDMQRRSFRFHCVLDKSDICNYNDFLENIKKLTAAGRRVIIFGRRNTGKTSLVHGIVLPWFLTHNKNAMVVYCDLLGVKDLTGISRRFREAFQEGFAHSYPLRSESTHLLSAIKSLRPVMSMDESGKMNLSLGQKARGEEFDFSAIIAEMGKLHKSIGKVLLVLDEMQDIHGISEAEAKLRIALEKLPSDLPIIVLGSKKHLLSRMFTDQKAPFFSWGLPLEMPQIDDTHYISYINERLRQAGAFLTSEGMRFLMTRLQGIPESINIVCNEMLMELQNDTAPPDTKKHRMPARNNTNEPSLDIKPLGESEMHIALMKTLANYRSFFSEEMSRFTAAEEDVLSIIAANQPVANLTSKSFLTKISTSMTGMRAIVKRFEDQAIIYHEKNGYVLADPLLALYLTEKGSLPY